MKNFLEKVSNNLWIFTLIIVIISWIITYIWYQLSNYWILLIYSLILMIWMLFSFIVLFMREEKKIKLLDILPKKWFFMKIHELNELPKNKEKAIIIFWMMIPIIFINSTFLYQMFINIDNFSVIKYLEFLDWYFNVWNFLGLYWFIFALYSIFDIKKTKNIENVLSILISIWINIWYYKFIIYFLNNYS